MVPSESAIASAVANLKKSPGSFQRLVERYAQLEFPERFQKLVPKGRNPQDIAIKGWPDAYALSPDGRVDAVEATHSNAWERHLEDDYVKVQELGSRRVAGLLFVAWAPAPALESTQRHRARFVGLGVPAEEIKFVFQQELVAALRQPRFAHVWVDLLQLRCECAPFAPMESPRHFGREDQPATFAPSKSEYLQGKVHRPKLADTVEAQLAGRGWALVRGKGAAGKTVLATQTALGPRFGHTPAYYLNLAEFSGEAADLTLPRAQETITTRADHGVLFIIDNVHLNESFAWSVFDHWRAVQNNSSLLLLGRLVAAGPDPRGLAGALDEIESEALVSEVRPEDLCGVWTRLARRGQDVSTVPEPPEQVLQEWSRLFGGDLIAFSAAVARRRDDLMSCQWLLRAQDAVDYVREVYLDRLSEEAERRNLLRLAMLSRLEFDLPGAATERPGLKCSLQTGIVHRTERGRERYVRFHLVHPGIGELLIAAAHAEVDERSVFKDVGRQDARSGLALAGRLETSGRLVETTEVLTAIMESPAKLAQGLVAGLGYVARSSDRLDRTGVSPCGDTDNLLIADEVALRDAALRTPFHSLASFLEYAERTLPKVHASLATTLGQAESLKALGESALRTPLCYLASFLKYAERTLPKVHASLATTFGHGESLKVLGESALRAPLGDLASFLKYAERTLPKVHASLATTFGQAESLKALGESALRTPLDSLTAFLEYAERTLPKVHASLATTLGQAESLKALGESALRTPLESLTAFLEYTRLKLLHVHGELTRRLALPAAIDELSRAACTSSPQAVLRFMRTIDFGPAVVAKIDRHEWNRARLAETPQQPDFIVSFTSELRKLNCEELAEPLAQSLVRDADPSRWHVSGITHFHASYVLRLGRASGSESIKRFVARVVTEEWLTRQYETSTPSSIGASLFAVWSYFDEDVLHYFRTVALGKRLQQVMHDLESKSLADVSHSIQLCGAAGLVGVAFSTADLNWPSPARIRELVQYTAPARQTLELRVIQLWLGLRRMSVLRQDAVAVPPNRGNDILGQWRSAAAVTPRQNLLNEWMIDWLVRCSDSGWTLVRDSSWMPPISAPSR